MIEFKTNIKPNMNKKSIFLLSAASMMLFASCSKLGALSADNFTVTPNPLETQAGTVPATINGHFPEKYMKKKAVVTVIRCDRSGQQRHLPG